jgi:hypothetical protein
MQMPESRQKKTFSRRKSNRSLTCCVIKSWKGLLSTSRFKKPTFMKLISQLQF